MVRKEIEKKLRRLIKVGNMGMNGAVTPLLLPAI